MGEPWETDAACSPLNSPGVDPEWWFSADDMEQRWALEICGGCPVQLECFESGVRNDDRYGIRAGHDFAAPTKTARAQQKAARQARGLPW